jgi:ribulose-5-phosphate 4-epimerase/fuculose-1-phosphate aldolase
MGSPNEMAEAYYQVLMEHYTGLHKLLASTTLNQPLIFRIIMAKSKKTKPENAKPKKAKPQRYQESRVDLSTALRWAAHLGLNEGVCNHFSFEVAPDLYLINPQGLHWSEVMPDDILLIDSSGAVLDGKHGLEPTAFYIHSWIHKLNPHAKCVLHTHMPFTTALSLVEGGRLEWCNQNALRFYGRIAYEDHYNGVALDAAEGERIARQLAGKDVMLMASHGVTVVGKSIAWAFDDLYYLERACMHQALAQQLAGKKRLRSIPVEVCQKVSEQIESERQQSDLSFAAIKRMLAR